MSTLTLNYMTLQFLSPLCHVIAQLLTLIFLCYIEPIQCKYVALCQPMYLTDLWLHVSIWFCIFSDVVC